MKVRSSILLSLVTIVCVVSVAAGVDLGKCFDDFQKSGAGIEAGGTDNTGRRVAAADATGLTFLECEKRCGAGQTPPDWSVFSKQFTSWLLPWLALLSQLPFGATIRKDNIVALLLNVGSPTLAAYSLVLTVLNGHYVVRRFEHITYPNTYYAVRVLAGLQQSALRITTDDGLLASLIVLPQNDKWWVEMTRLIHYEHTWTISALANISWVIVAYFFTVLDSFTDVTEAINSNGQSVGSLWLWLVPIVVGWLMVSPKCDAKRLDDALSEANEIACVATTNPDVVMRACSSESHLGARRAFTFEKFGVLSPPTDEGCTSPVFNYARLLPWMACVERVAEAFEAASGRAENHLPVNKEGGKAWKPVEDDLKEQVHVDNRKGTLEQVIGYCSSSVLWPPSESRWHPNIIGRMIIASLIGLTLQWCTAGSAVMVVWFTPTTGLGCRSGSYIIYALGSTVIWAMMLTSSVLMYHAVDRKTLRYEPETASMSQRVACNFAVVINRTAKVFAALNSIWIIAVCLFQFLNVFNTCYCNSSVLGRGRETAYNVIKMLSEEAQITLSRYWAGAVTISLASAFTFIIYITIFLNTSKVAPPHRAH